MNEKEQLLMNITKAMPTAQKMQTLENKIEALENKCSKNKVGLGFTVLSLIMLFLGFSAFAGLSESTVKENDKILLITFCVIAAVIILTFFKRVICRITAKCGLIIYKKKLTAYKNDPSLSWIPIGKRTASYIFELSEYAEQRISEQFKSILAGKDLDNTKRNGHTRRSSAYNNNHSLNREYDYRQAQQPMPSSVTAHTNNSKISEEKLDRLVHDIFSRLDLPSIKYSLESNEKESSEKMNKGIHLSPDIKISLLVKGFEAQCEYCRTLTDGVPENLLDQMTVISHFIIESRMAYDFVRASTAVIQFEENGKIYVGCRSLLDSVETYAYYISCLTDGSNVEWMSELAAVKPKYSNTPEDLYEEKYQSIADAPINNKTVKQALSALTNNYTVGDVQKVIDATNNIMHKFNIDKEDIVNSTYYTLSYNNKNGTAFTLTKDLFNV